MPTYDLKCQTCGQEWERWSTIANRYDPCACGGPVEQQFKHSVQATVFVPYFDFALGKQIDSLAQRHREMRSAHLDYRDKLSSAQLGERREREEHRRHERERGHAPGGSNRTSGRVYSR